MRDGGCGHVIFEGQPGVGKRTMIWAMLRDAYGPDRIQVRTYMYFCISVLVYKTQSNLGRFDKICCTTLVCSVKLGNK